MAKEDSINCDNLPQRKSLFVALGGLPETAVKNSEWLYMLAEETRQSLSIEGYFATEQELKAILQGHKTAPEILNYHRTAQSLYDLASQNYYERDLPLRMSLVRHIHSELFRTLNEDRGNFRKKSIQIHGAKVRPPEFDIDAYMRAWLSLSQDVLEHLPILAALARIHTLFESIHPFEDGNGRAGRIILNYLAISQGYLPIIIKGLHKEDRDRYYQALESADQGFQRGFPEAQPEALRKRLEEGNFGRLEALLCEGISPWLDKMIITNLEHQEPLLEFKQLAPQMGVQESTLRQWVHRGKLIAIKRGKKLYSHSRLFLE